MPNKKMILILDTETCDLAGNVYDVGVVITDKTGKTYAQFNALVTEVFQDAKKMMGAFYAKKLFTHYARMLQDGEIRLQWWEDIRNAIRSLVVNYDVSVIAAYNLGFDLRVMNQTNKLFSSDKILPEKDYELLDIWQFACEAKLNSATYKRLAKDMGWVSNAGNLKTGAEYAYRFCSGDWGFIEDHTALSDAQIEREILRACFASKKSIPYGKINQHPWKIVNQ